MWGLPFPEGSGGRHWLVSGIGLRVAQVLQVPSSAVWASSGNVLEMRFSGLIAELWSQKLWGWGGEQ